MGLFLLLMLVNTAAWSEDQPHHNRKTFTLLWENDVFANTDRNYTNGLKLTWSELLAAEDTSRSRSARWGAAVMNRLPLMKDQGAKRALSFSVGQNIYTPEDTDRAELIENERPYAGYLYVGLGFHAIKDGRSDIWEIDLGVVGPLALGEQLQDFTHKLTGSSLPQGWDNQLNNEPTLEIIYETKWRSWRWQTDDHFGFDFIPHLGARLGNVAIYANGGAEFRFGWYVPEDFGSCPIRPACNLNSAARALPGDSDDNRSGLHLFVGVDGRAVLRDIFIDGNTFTDSHSVDREAFVSDWIAGIAASYRRYKFSYAYVLRTKEFKQQKDPQIFGTLTFSFSY